MRVLTLLLFAVSALAQNAPRVNMDTLMNLQFYPNDGGMFRVENIGIIFPPPGAADGKVILTKNGKVISTAAVKSAVRPENGFSAFGILNAGPANPSGFFKAAGTGDYTMSVELAGRNIGGYSFKIEEEKSADPFNPKSGFKRTGPWSKTAIIGRAVDRPNESVRVGVWLNTRDLPGYKPKTQTPYTAQITRAGKELCFVEGVASDEEWTYYVLPMMQGTRAAKGPFKWEDLTKTPGDYSFVIKVNNAIAKEFKFKVAGGTIVRIPQNELAYQGNDALAPQGVPNNQGTYMREERFWLAPIQ